MVSVHEIFAKQMIQQTKQVPFPKALTLLLSEESSRYFHTIYETSHDLTPGYFYGLICLKFSINY